MSDLAQLLAQFEREEFAASVDAQLPETRQHAVRRTVVRARRVRAAATLAVAAVAVVACGTGAWALTQVDRNDPAVPHPSPSATTSNPSQSPSPTPSPSATAEPVLTMPAFTGDVTVDPQLPTAQAITPEAWNTAGPGWVLATYRENFTVWNDATQTTIDTFGPQVAYLISPDGVRYQLTPIPGDSSVRVVAWTPLTTTALAIKQPAPLGGPAQNTWVVLDLVTGTTRPLTDADVTASAWNKADLASISGTTMQRFGGPYYDDPIDGSGPLDALPPGPTAAVQGDLDAARATAQALVPAEEKCDNAMTTETMVVVECTVIITETWDQGVGQSPYVTQGTYARHFVFVSDLGRGSGTVVSAVVAKRGTEDRGVGSASLPLGDGAAVIGDRVVVGAQDESQGPPPCDLGEYVASPRGLEALPGVEATREGLHYLAHVGTAGTSTYTVRMAYCGNPSDESLVLVRDNISDGTWTVLIPSLPRPPGSNPEAMFSESLLSAYVVPEGR
jgi:hypothetical protein